MPTGEKDRPRIAEPGPAPRRQPPRNKGLRYPADPPKVEEIIAVMRGAGDDAHGRRLRGLIVVCGERGCASRKRWPSPNAI